MDQASTQLQLELRQAVQDALATRRPLLHRLATGPSWLLQLPRPDSAIRRGARLYYNILIDPSSPSRTGPDDCVTGLTHCVRSAEDIALELESLACQSLHPDPCRHVVATEDRSSQVETLLDLVLLRQDQSDPRTWVTIHPDVPVLTSRELMGHVESLLHFRTVALVPSFGLNGERDWQATSIPPLPDWIGISTLPRPEQGQQHIEPFVIIFNNGQSVRAGYPAKGKCHDAISLKEYKHNDAELGGGCSEAIILTSRALEVGTVRPVAFADPALRCLACLYDPLPRSSLAASHEPSSNFQPSADALRILNPWYQMQGTVYQKPTPGRAEGSLWTWLQQWKHKLLGASVAPNADDRMQKSSNGVFNDTSPVDEVTAIVELPTGESRLLS